MKKPVTARKARIPSPWLLFAVLLAGALAVLFIRSFEPNQVLFANDGPLGALQAAWNRLPSGFTGIWEDLGWLGGEVPSAAPRISAFLMALLSPVWYLKTFAPLTLFFVGFSAWLFFRQLEFNPVVCALGGVAAGLNMHCFSVACWGLGTWDLAIGSIFLALAALSTKSIKPLWAKGILAGLAVGMNLMEGFDCGAILSVYVGVFVVFVICNRPAPTGQKILQSLGVGALVVFFSALLAAHTIVSLVSTQIIGVAGNGAKEDHWDFNTQWSLPKAETLRVLIPGIFGYRLEQYITVPDKSSAYWGISGQDPKIAELQSDDPKMRVKAAAAIGAPANVQQILAGNDAAARAQVVDALRTGANLYPRHTGSGEYAGELVCLLALFGVANAFRRLNPPYSVQERRAVWFWTGAALFSLLTAWGRFGFLYGWLYQIPYVSTIRNPIKFMHPFHVAWVILAAYGMECLARRSLPAVKQPARILPEQILLWWKKVTGFEKNWTIALLVAVAVSIVALLILNGSTLDLVRYLESEGFNAELAPKIVHFALGEALWFLIYLVLSVVVLTGILSGAWTGPGAKRAWFYLGAILICDLGRADQPWTNYFDYKEKYAMNPAVEILEKQPYEHRVTARLAPAKAISLSGNNEFDLMCFFWLQNDFLYHDIQSAEIIQAPRMPIMDRTYMGAFNAAGSDLTAVARLWQLTNTRYLLGGANIVPQLNAQADPQTHSFRLIDRYNIAVKPGVTNIEDVGDLTVVRNDQGEFGLIEFTNVLPRAKLYAQWQTMDDDAELPQLASSSFDPTRTVLLSKSTPVSPASSSTEADPGTVTITDYQPKKVRLQAQAKTPSILLLNDRIAPDWKAWVDKKPVPVLRCNYIMRGVLLTPGEHTVEFRFEPPLSTLYISLTGWAVGLALAGYLFFTRSSAYV
ncbi:MAG TPA: hypothetical protein VFC44_23725 [Candidatus Saccharimonadales bacterium]|nr:hypothetical protein [Candidatus Saccharimonadales bacterium]